MTPHTVWKEIFSCTNNARYPRFFQSRWRDLRPFFRSVKDTARTIALNADRPMKMARREHRKSIQRAGKSTRGPVVRKAAAGIDFESEASITSLVRRRGSHVDARPSLVFFLFFFLFSLSFFPSPLSLGKTEHAVRIPDTFPRGRIAEVSRPRLVAKFPM